VSDFLLQLGGNRNARKLVKTLGLPIPLPQALRRAQGPWEDRPLADQTVVLGGALGNGATGEGLGPVLAQTLVAAGANPHLVRDVPPAFRELGEAYGRPPQTIDPTALPERLKADALVFDASALDAPGDLRALFDFFNPLLASLVPGGRVLVLGRPAQAAADPLQAAARAALDGFVRSLAKEIGKRGATAQLVMVAAGAEKRLPPVLRFLLSARSAFVSGQPLTVDGVVAGNGEPPLVRPLEGQVALVTGAARGIGEATAKRLAEEGAHVICVDRPPTMAPPASWRGPSAVRWLPVDVSDPGAPSAMADFIRQHHGGVLDILVHNAGITRDKTLARMSPSSGIRCWTSTSPPSAASTRRWTCLLRDRGRVVYLSSVAGLAGNLGQTNYAASKAGVAGYVRKQAECWPTGASPSTASPPASSRPA
jgi:3-oxoacyl-[acyl-carrier protein] reductase